MSTLPIKARATGVCVAFALLLAAAGVASAQTSADDPCRAIFAGDPDAAGTDPQPSQEEIKRRLAEAGCPTDDVDTSPGVAREEDQLDKDLMDQSAEDSNGETPR